MAAFLSLFNDNNVLNKKEVKKVGTGILASKPISKYVDHRNFTI